jgi:ribonuclease P protein component
MAARLVLVEHCPLIRDNALEIAQPHGRRWLALARRADFLRIAACGLRRVTPAFILQAAPRGEHPTPALRIGFTASRKVGNAVARNRAKRRLRALADREMAGLEPVFDYVLVGRPESLSRNFAVMAGDLRYALKKIAAHPKVSAPQATSETAAP